MRIEIPTATVVDPAGVTAYPFIESATSLFILGGGALSSVKNRAGGPDGVVSGSILYQPSYARFSGSSQTNYIQTSQVDIGLADVAQTLISVSRMPNPASGDAVPGRSLFSSYNGTTNFGISLVNTGGLMAHGDGVDAAYFEDGGAYQEAFFRFKAVVTAQDNMKLVEVVGGKLVISEDMGIESAVNGDRPLRIGGDYFAGGYDDTCDIAMVSRHAASLTLEQLQYIYDYVKAYYAARGERVL
ncbi:hypothetical protein [Sphingobium sp. DC-2]|uniref:hypothetical protein n=1 Tax=Sphingobium sp. DC-2 TaxID=1303256 RepID=UPI0004C3162A|nr:hypothetical protein [Sphingobium sp. DC-2]